MRNYDGEKSEKGYTSTKTLESRYCLYIRRYIDLGCCESIASCEWTSLRAAKKISLQSRHPYAMDGWDTVKERFECPTGSARERERVEAIW